MITGCLVRNTRWIDASTAWPSSANSGPRWSMVGMSIARSTRSGTLVGPGICRKCLPLCTVISVLPGGYLRLLRALAYHYSGGLSPARRAPSMAEIAGFHSFSARDDRASDRRYDLLLLERLLGMHQKGANPSQQQ